MEQSRRLRLDLAYDGTNFHGWALQPGLRTVEGVLADALETVLRRPVKLTVAGRTDAGVHARAQVAHVDLQRGEDPGDLEGFRRRVQGLLVRDYSEHTRPTARTSATDLVLQAVTPVDDTFDARFSALQRHYRYRLVEALSLRDPLDRVNAWWHPNVTLDLDLMNEAAGILLGEHDFLSFCRPREGATTIRTLRVASVSRQLETQIVELRFSADAFCHSMVRSLVGALVEVGRGKRPLDWVGGLLAHPGRHHGVPVVPACGLTLERVDYPAAERWAERAAEARNVRCLEC